MPNFCPNCAATLDPDAKFCPSCSSPITQATYPGTQSAFPGSSGMGYGGGMSPGMQPGMQRSGAAFNMAGAKVDPLIWAGVISLFWFLWFFISGMTEISNLLSVARLGVGTNEAAVIFALINNAFHIAGAAVYLVLAYGIFNKKRWAHGLFMMSIGPLALLWLILSVVTFFAPGSSSAGVVIVYILGLLMGIGLIGLLFMLVTKNKHQFTNN